MFNFSRFRSYISAHGILKTTKFRVEFANIPEPLRARYPEIGTTLQLMCETASLPGIGLMTKNVRRLGYGATEKRPYSPNFTDQIFTFIGDGDGLVWRFFKDWIHLINNFNSTREGIQTRGNNTEQFEFSFPKEYQSDVKIYVYHDNGDVKLLSTMIEAYPVGIGNIPFNWGNINNYMKVPVELTFRTWYNE